MEFWAGEDAPWSSEQAELHPLVVLCHSGRGQLPLADLASLAFSDPAPAFVPPATLDQQNGSTLQRKLTEGAAAYKPLLLGSGERLRQLEALACGRRLLKALIALREILNRRLLCGPPR